MSFCSLTKGTTLKTCRLCACVISKRSFELFMCLDPVRTGSFSLLKSRCMQILAWLAVVLPETFLFCPLYVFIHCSAAFCTTHCALDLARAHAP